MGRVWGRGGRQGRLPERRRPPAEVLSRSQLSRGRSARAAGGTSRLPAQQHPPRPLHPPTHPPVLQQLRDRGLALVHRRRQPAGGERGGVRALVRRVGGRARRQPAASARVSRSACAPGRQRRRRPSHGGVAGEQLGAADQNHQQHCGAGGWQLAGDGRVGDAEQRQRRSRARPRGEAQVGLGTWPAAGAGPAGGAHQRGSRWPR